MLCSGKGAGCAFKGLQSRRGGGLATQEAARGAMRVSRSHVSGPGSSVGGWEVFTGKGRNPRSQ